MSPTNSAPSMMPPVNTSARLSRRSCLRRHVGTRGIMLVAGRRSRVIDEEGGLLRKLVLDSSRDYQPHGGPRVSTMSHEVAPVF
jgi:hypothetical protein